jgi:pimeloyl-ACP methyl ester carboxylesterase
VTTAVERRTLVRPDGTRIAYRVEGRGPALVLTNGLTTSTVFWKHLVPAWSRAHTVVTWDLPGHGDSGPAGSPGGAGIDAQARTVVALMDQVGIERAVQVGWSTGCQIVCELLREHEGRASALALLLGPAGRVLETARLPLSGAFIGAVARFAPPGALALGFRALSQVARTPLGDPLGRALGLLGPDLGRADAEQVLRHIPTVDPVTAQRMLVSAAQHDARALLGKTRLPVLIVAGDVDPFAPADLVGAPLHRLAPGSELVRLPAGTHTALLDHAPLIAERVERFAAAFARSA